VGSVTSKHPLQSFVVRYEAGEPVFVEGDVGATMYIVQSGKVQLFRDVEGEAHVLGELEKGDFFGEMSILEGMPRTSCAKAVEAAELIEINSTTFDKMIKGNIEIAIRMLRKLSIRLRAAERKIESLQASGAVAAGMPRQAGPPKPQSAKERPTGLRLECEEGATSFGLDENDTLIGRYDPVTEQTPDIDLTEVDLKRSVSRRHARVVRTDDGYALIEEVGALNGTFVNGRKLVAGERHPINDGDQVSLGMVKMTFRTGTG
jgi:CRP-like cAMP-binding protein